MADNPDIWTALRKIDELRNELRESIEHLDAKHNETEKQTAKELAGMERMIIEKDAARKDDIAKLDKTILVEGFGLQQKVSKLDWKVVVLVGAIMAFLGFVAKDLHFTDFTGKNESSQLHKRGGG